MAKKSAKKLGPKPEITKKKETLKLTPEEIRRLSELQATYQMVQREIKMFTDGLMLGHRLKGKWMANLELGVMVKQDG